MASKYFTLETGRVALVFRGQRDLNLVTLAINDGEGIIPNPYPNIELDRADLRNLWAIITELNSYMDGL